MPRPRKDAGQLRQLALMGARTRLDELRREESGLRSLFPELFAGRRGRPRKAAGAPRRRRRRRMSAAARKAVSQRMKRYWAERRKQKRG